MFLKKLFSLIGLRKSEKSKDNEPKVGAKATTKQGVERMDDENKEVVKATDSAQSTAAQTDTAAKTEPQTDKAEQQPIPEQQPAPQVANVEPTGNGIRVEDLVTKDELTERLSALTAKLEAIINENKGLMDRLTEMSDKYENKDFGTLTKKGVSDNTGAKTANETFDEYCKRFE